jgi:hypothetical protein
MSSRYTALAQDDIELQPMMEDSRLATDQKRDVGGDSPGDGDSLNAVTVAALPKGTLDPVYAAKATVLNNAIQEIGMGSYVLSI